MAFVAEIFCVDALYRYVLSGLKVLQEKQGLFWLPSAGNVSIRTKVFRCSTVQRVTVASVGSRNCISCDAVEAEWMQSGLHSPVVECCIITAATSWGWAKSRDAAKADVLLNWQRQNCSTPEVRIQVKHNEIGRFNCQHRHPDTSVTHPATLGSTEDPSAPFAFPCRAYLCCPSVLVCATAVVAYGFYS